MHFHVYVPNQVFSPLFRRAFVSDQHINLQSIESNSELCLISSIFMFEFMLHQSSPTLESTSPQTKRPTVFIWLGCLCRLATPTMFHSVEGPQVVFALFLLLSVALQFYLKERHKPLCSVPKKKILSVVYKLQSLE